MSAWQRHLDDLVRRAQADVSVPKENKGWHLGPDTLGWNVALCKIACRDHTGVVHWLLSAKPAYGSTNEDLFTIRRQIGVPADARERHQGQIVEFRWDTSDVSCSAACATGTAT